MPNKFVLKKKATEKDFYKIIELLQRKLSVIANKFNYNIDVNGEYKIYLMPKTTDNYIDKIQVEFDEDMEDIVVNIFLKKISNPFDEMDLYTLYNSTSSALKIVNKINSIKL